MSITHEAEQYIGVSKSGDTADTEDILEISVDLQVHVKINMGDGFTVRRSSSRLKPWTLIPKGTGTRIDLTDKNLSKFFAEVQRYFPEGDLR